MLICISRLPVNTMKEMQTHGCAIRRWCKPFQGLKYTLFVTCGVTGQTGGKKSNAVNADSRNMHRWVNNKCLDLKCHLAKPRSKRLNSLSGYCALHVRLDHMALLIWLLYNQKPSSLYIYWNILLVWHDYCNSAHRFRLVHLWSELHLKVPLSTSSSDEPSIVVSSHLGSPYIWPAHLCFLNRYLSLVRPRR